MIGRCNTGGGGGISNTSALLCVTVPTGSTVTAEKDNVVLTPQMWTLADDSTQDCAIFFIDPSLFDSENAWEITAAMSGHTTSELVVIDSPSEYSITLIYRLYIIKDGEFVVELTKSGGTLDSRTLGNTYCAGLNSGGNYVRVAYTTEAIDVSFFDTLNSIIYLMSSWSSTGVPYFGICEAEPTVVGNNSVQGYTYGVKPSSVGSGTRTPYEIDVSSYSGEYYIAFSTSGTSSGSGTYYMSDFYLEKA